MLKFKAKKIAVKEGTSKSTGKPYKIVTILTETGEKIKAFGGEWEEGKEYEMETEMKKDRDGFDELWIKSARTGFAGRTFNLWPNAYQVAVAYADSIGENDLKEIDKYAQHFHGKFLGQAPAKKDELPDAQSHSEEKTVNIDDIPF